MTYFKFYVPVVTIMLRSVDCRGRSEVIVARGVIIISTESWLNRRASNVEKAASRRRNIPAHIASRCK